MSVKEAFFKANIQGIIALIIIVGGLSLIAFADISDSTNTTISNFIMLVLGFYFGSSRSTGDKDKTIAEFVNKKE